MSSLGLFSKAVHGVRWIGFMKGISQVVMWVITIYVVRLLEPEDYGLIAMAGVLSAFAGLLLDGGLAAALVQRRDVSSEVYRSANGALLLSSGIVVGIVQLLAWPIAVFFSEPRLEGVIRLTTVVYPLTAMAVVPSAVLMKRLGFKELGIASGLSGALGNLITLTLALNDFGVWALVLGHIAIVGLKTLFLNIFVGRPEGISFRLSVLKSYVPFSAHLVTQRVVWFYVEQIDRLIIGKALGAGPLGSYSVARQLSHTPLERTAEIVNQVTLPSFSAIQSEKERWHSALQKLIRLASTVSYPMFFGMAAVAPIALPLLLGERWQGSVWPFVLFCVALPLRTAHSLVATVLFALGRADVSLKVVVIWAAVLTPMFLVGVFFGATGVAAAWALGFPIAYALGARSVAASLSIPIEGLWTPMFAPAMSAFGCVAVVFVVYVLCAGRLSPIVTMALEIAGGGVAYGLLLRLLSRRAFHEISDLLQRFAGREQPA